MKALEELRFRQRVEIIKPSYCELLPLGQEHLDSYCQFCSQTAEYWLHRVYSFGGNSDRVCGDCASQWQSVKGK
jgi:hypothetical protein